MSVDNWIWPMISYYWHKHAKVNKDSFVKSPQAALALQAYTETFVANSLKLDYTQKIKPAAGFTETVIRWSLLFKPQNLY